MPISPFLRIPRELRDRIYHFALLNQCARFRVANLSLDVHYVEELDTVARYEKDNWRWLLTSRQVLLEGLDQFYMHAELQYYNIVDRGYTHDLTLDGSTSIFDLRRVKAAQLCIKLGKRYPSEDIHTYYDFVGSVGNENWDECDENFSELGKVIKSMDHHAFEDLKLMVYLFTTSARPRNFADRRRGWLTY